MVAGARLSRVRRRIAAAAIAVAVVGTGAGVAIPLAANAGGSTSGTVSGIVYRDYDNNGTRDALEPGEAGIEVRVYDADGDLVGGPIASVAGGAYSVSVSGARSTEARVEFTIPSAKSFLRSGPGAASGTNASGTSVQFVTMDDATVDFGVHNPSEYCQGNPTMVTGCFVFGDPVDGTGAALPHLYSFPYDGSGSPFDNTRTDDPATTAVHSETGATFGLEYNRATGDLYAGAFHKVYAGFGPGGPGAVYRVNSAGAVSTLATIPNAGTDPRASFSPNTAQYPALDDPWLRDPTFDLVGKSSLGDIQLTDDNATLWVVNLNDRQLYPVTTATGAVGTPVAIPRGTGGTAICPTDDARPFGMGKLDTKFYVGVVCSSTLQMYVHRFNPATASFEAAPAFETSLTGFDRGSPGNGCGPNSGLGNWNAWISVDNFQDGSFCAYPQPMVGGIAFDRGNMIIGLRDRYGDQAGENYPIIDPVTGFEARRAESVAGGDIMRACGSVAAGWTLENNASCGGVATSGAGNVEGPGRGEFYFNDRFYLGGNHNEVSMGSVVQLAGVPTVAQVVFDPSLTNGEDWRSGGLQYYSNATGVGDHTYTIFDKCDSSGIGRAPGAPVCGGQSVAQGTFGKANGLSDLVALCELAPVQLGNRVWLDADADGLQDAGEAPVVGATVNLYDGATPVDSTTTGADGTYLFDGLTPGIAYRVTLDNAEDYLVGGPLAGYAPTTADVGGAASDAIDSDGIAVGGYAATSHTPAAAGDNNHTLDFGFVPSFSLGNRVWFDADRSGVIDGGDGANPGIGGVALEAVRVADGSVADTATTDPDGYYCFDQLPAGAYRVRATAANFTGAGALVSHVSSSGAGQAPGVDSGTDNDDDGDDVPVSGAVLTGTVNLGPGSTEPAGDADPIECESSGDTRGDQTVDLGFFPLSAVGNYVWIDANNDGIQNDGAASGLNGVRVTLLDESSNPVTINGLGGSISPITTANDSGGNPGYYEFANLVPGNYRVRFDNLSAAFRATGTDLGGDDALDSDGLLTPVINLVAGERDLTLDLGVVAPTSVGNFAWIDANANGIQDVGETGLAGVTATLQTAAGVAVTQDIDGATIAPQVTGSDGLYLFSNLAPGQYRVVFTPPTGWLASPSAQGGDTAADSTNPAVSAVLAPNQVDMTLDSGFWQPASVGNFVWRDDNRNGTQDGSEPGVGGVTVTLQTAAGAAVLDASNNPVGPATAAAGTGLYLFPNLRPGSYRVVFSNLPAGFSPTLTDAAANDQIDSDGLTTAPVAVASGQSNLTLDLGIFAPVSVGNFVWRDNNANGIQDGGEPGIDGARCTLTTMAGGSVTDMNGNAVGVATTAGGGAYLFANLLPGQYRVSCATPAGLVPSPADAGADSVDSDGPVGTSRVLAPGQNDTDLDFGFAPLASVGNYVWVDADNDGVQNDGAAAGLNGVRVTLVDASSNPVTVDGLGGAITPIFTANDGAGNAGYYEFNDLAPGDYRVRFDNLPGGFAATGTDLGGDDALDSDGLLTPVTNLVAGERDLTLDLGVFAPTSVGDFVWIDTNANGIQDGGEPGLAGVTATLQTAAGVAVTRDANSNPITPLVTGPNGRYLFTDLVPGQYRVVFTAPAGWIPSPAAQGGNTAADSTNPAVSAVLGPNQVDLTLDAGFWQPASVGNYVWMDDNRNGTQDVAERGVAGVSVALQDGAGGSVDDATGNPVGPTTTDANGLYLFPNLRPGSYRVVFSNLPAGYVATLTDAAANDQIDSDGLSTAAVTVGAGEANLTLDLGIFAPVAVGDFVWLDNNGNGQQDPGEPGIAGAVCTLTTGAGGSVSDADGNPVTTATTDDLGFYSFTNLMPGQYRVTCATPAGLAPTIADAVSDELDSDGAAGVSRVLSGGQTDSTLDFGFVPPSSLGDLVWFDENLNGLQDVGERVIVGVPVELLDPDTRAVLASTTTDSAGYYSFDGLRAGRYLVHFALPGGGFVVTAHNFGGNDEADSDADRATGLTQVVTLAPGERNPTIDAGAVPASSLAGKSYHDINNDGHPDGNEPGIPGVVITLEGTDVWGNAVRLQTTTAADGTYVFDYLAPGEYIVAQIQPADWEDGQDRPGTAGGVTLDDRTVQIRLGVGVRSVQNNFGERKSLDSTRGGRTATDTNNNTNSDNSGSDVDSNGDLLASTGARIMLSTSVGVLLLGLGVTLRLAGRRRGNRVAD